MKDLQQQFVTYPIAVKLQELGFNEPCLAEYYYSPLLIKEKKDACLLWGDQSGLKEALAAPYYTAAPLWQQAEDWLREEYSIQILEQQLSFMADVKAPAFCVKKAGNYPFNGFTREAAILKALELIKQ